MTDDPAQLPNRLRDLKPSVIEFLARLSEDELRNLLFVCNWSDAERKRLQEFLDLPDEEYRAGYQVVTTVVRLRWLGIKGFWLASSVAAILVIYSQIRNALTGGSQ